MGNWIDVGIIVFVVVAPLIAWLLKLADPVQKNTQPEIARESNKFDRGLDRARTAAWIVFLGGVAVYGI